MEPSPARFMDQLPTFILMQNYSGNNESGTNYPILYLSPGDGVKGTVSLNGNSYGVADQAQVEVSPVVPVYEIGVGEPVLVVTQQGENSPLSKYLFWRKVSGQQKYFQSNNINGEPSTMLTTVQNSNNHLNLQLELDGDTIVIGTVIIDIEM